MDILSVKLFAQLTALGVRLTAAGPDTLTLDAPRATLTPGLRASIQQHKGDLLCLLAPLIPAFEYRIFERLWLEIGSERCPLCRGELHCWPAPPQSDVIGYGCRNAPRVHRWTARLSVLFPEIGKTEHEKDTKPPKDEGARRENKK